MLSKRIVTLLMVVSAALGFALAQEAYSATTAGTSAPIDCDGFPGGICPEPGAGGGGGTIGGGVVDPFTCPDGQMPYCHACVGYECVVRCQGSRFGCSFEKDPPENTPAKCLPRTKNCDQNSTF